MSRTTTDRAYSLPVSLLHHLQRARHDHAEGDNRALDALLRRVTGKIRARLATRLRGVLDLDSAIDEIVQEALWKLVAGMAQARARSDAQAWAWLWTLVEHARIDYLRRERHRGCSVPVDGILGRRLCGSPDEDPAGADASPGDRALLACLMRAYDELPPSSAAFVWGRVILSMSDAEAGRELGASASAMKRRWQRVQARLRRETLVHLARLDTAEKRRLAISAMRARRAGRLGLAQADVMLDG